MTFFLGTHETGWLGRAGVPLCVSARRLRLRRKFPRAAVPWMLDSGGFSEISLHGCWITSVQQYVAEVRRWSEEIGSLVSAACQDWMCEPGMLARTGLSVREHQMRTINSLINLRERAPELPWFPVLQGWEPESYLEHVGLYTLAGIDLGAEPMVGLGSVCRRQNTGAIEAVVSALRPLELRLHGFGVKEQGVARVAPWLASADSLAWSFHARRRPPLSGCSHSSCANCLRYALAWRERLLALLSTPRAYQLQLEFSGLAA